MKRYCGMKDYGTIFPGHGGMMDRMDGVLFSGVVCHWTRSVYSILRPSAERFFGLKFDR